MQRGPVARVPFCAIFRLPYERDAAFCETVSTIVSGRRETGKRRRRLMNEGGTGADERSFTDENGRPEGGRSSSRRACAGQGASAQMQFRHAEGEVESNRSRHRDRLQRHRVVGPAQENVGAESRGDRHLSARAEIVAGEKARAGRGEAVGEHRPYHHATAGGTISSPNLLIEPL